MDYLEKNRYPIIGGIVGALIALCIFTIGFWKMILVLFLIGLGIYIGLFLKRTGIIDLFRVCLLYTSPSPRD